MHAPYAEPVPMAGGSLAGWLAGLADRWGDRVALATSAGADVFSYATLADRTARLSIGLRQLGLNPGDAIALWLPNRPDWMALHLGAARAGLTTIPLNTWYRESEVSHFVRLASCRAIIVDPSFPLADFATILEAAVADMVARGNMPLLWLIDAGAVQRAWPLDIPVRRLADLDQGSVPRLAEEPNEAMVTYATSGTTALPKLVVHREAVILSHAEAVAHGAQINESDIVLAALPPCGAYGYGLIMAALAGGAHTIQCPEFDIDRIVDIIRDKGVTVMALTEPLLRRLFDHPDACREAFASLRIVFSAGGTLRPVVERAERDFGVWISNVYGSSEALALAAFWPRDADVDTRSAAGGVLASAGMQVRAVDADGDRLPPGESGELEFRGPALAAAYLGDTRPLTSDGWFKSQDLGCVWDEAGTRFYYVARLNDAIRLKGFLVSPGEIEAMLLAHPAIAAAQVVGLADGRGEDVAAAFVLLRQGVAFDAAELRAFCRARMASYKVPTLLHALEAFPITRSANGDKIVKQRLRELATEIMSNAR